MGLGPVLHAVNVPRRIAVGGSTFASMSKPTSLTSADRSDGFGDALSAQAVTAYFGRFPAAQSRVRITVSDRGRVSGGMSFGEGGAHCRISVGGHATLENLLDDWELTHEMVHFSLPSVEDRRHWIEEGIATYVELIARASVGIITAERVWGEMLRDMPQGLPGDRRPRTRLYPHLGKNLLGWHAVLSDGRRRDS